MFFLLADRLKKLREDKKLRQIDMAKKLGVARTTYAMYEQGNRQPDYETLQKLADLFDVSIDYLLGRVNHPEVVLTEDERVLYDSIGKVPREVIKKMFDFGNATDKDIDMILEYVELLKIKRNQEEKRELSK